MKLSKLYLFAVLLPLLFPSCPVLPEDDVLAMYYKSAFLGTDSFDMSGTIHDDKGNPLSGSELIMGIIRHEDEWSVRTDIKNSNQFTVTINNTDNSDRSLLDFDPEYAYDTAWDIFTVYFTSCSDWPTGGFNDPERDKKMYSLVFFRDSFDVDYQNALVEFCTPKPVYTYTTSTNYVYIPEPVAIKAGTYTWEDEFGKYSASFDCDFSRPGWYKIVEDLQDPIGNNPVYTSSENIKLWQRKD